MKRRTFFKNTTVISTFTVLSPSIAFGTKINSAVRVGIIGCGNRGTAVITSMAKHTNTHIFAMADLFRDRLEFSQKRLDEQNRSKGLPGIEQSSTYVGFKAYEQLLSNNQVDAVLISSPAYTHPDFLLAAVRAGKHVYCEKPVAPDVAGCKRVQRVGDDYDGKISIAIGFQIRHASPYVEMVKRIQRGDIGDLISGELHYFSLGIPIIKKEGISDDEARIRNHFHFRALSGGILLDQGIHMLDVCNWVLKSNPQSAMGIGGVKGAPDFGDAWSNFQVLYRYPGNINVSMHSTQAGPHFGDVCARFIGTEGIAEAHYMGGVFIEGRNKWDSGIQRCENVLPDEKQRQTGVFLSSLSDADANKEIAFIESIESGNYLNEAKQGATSTLSAIVGRNAAISGESLNWDEVYASNEKLETGLDLSQFKK